MTAASPIATAVQPPFPEIVETVSDAGFAHPGIGFTADNLANMRTQVRAGVDPWASYYDAMVETRYGARDFRAENARPGTDAAKNDAYASAGMRSSALRDSIGAMTQALEYTVTGDEPLARAIDVMAEKDIGSLVVMDHGDLTGMLTFREVIQCIVKNGGVVGSVTVRTAMDDHPLTCTSETELDEVRRMMLGRHARYLPVLDGKTLMGVISFYDVAKSVVEAQDFENRMLKAYIRDWPVEEEEAAPGEKGG
jgi:CBS domain-containing protein